MKLTKRSVLSVFSVFTLAFAVAFLAAACRPNETVEGQTKDAQIKTAIKSKLAADVGASTLTAVQVNVTNGVVTLAGPVHSADEKSRIEAIARAAQGVVSVNNALQVMVDQNSSAGTGMTSVPAAPVTPAADAVPPAPTPSPAP